MRLLKETKAVSTLLLILLMLCSAVFGAFISYMWVMASFYLEPEGTVDLAITEVIFPVDHADFFNLTVMNPSHSPSGTTITEIYLTVEGDDNTYNVINTSPEELSIPLERATSKTVKCLRNWGEFAGKTITVHVSTVNASGATRSAKTEFVKLEVQTYFNATESFNYFNVTVKNNPQSAINLTLTKVYFDHESVEDMSIELPRNISKEEPPLTFQCFVDWRGHGKPLVQVETLEGYNVEKRQNVSSVVILPSAELRIAACVFGESAIGTRYYFNLTVSNSEFSSRNVTVSQIVVKTENMNYTIDGTITNPIIDPDGYILTTGANVTIYCPWNWSLYKGQTITITIFTTEGFQTSPQTFPVS